MPRHEDEEEVAPREGKEAHLEALGLSRGLSRFTQRLIRTISRRVSIMRGGIYQAPTVARDRNGTSDHNGNCNDDSFLAVDPLERNQGDRTCQI